MQVHHRVFRAPKVSRLLLFQCPFTRPCARTISLCLAYFPIQPPTFRAHLLFSRRFRFPRCLALRPTSRLDLKRLLCLVFDSSSMQPISPMPTTLPLLSQMEMINGSRQQVRRRACTWVRRKHSRTDTATRCLSFCPTKSLPMFGSIAGHRMVRPLKFLPEPLIVS